MEATRLPLYTTVEPQSKLPSAPNPQRTIEHALNSIFPQNIEENKVIQTRKHLGEKSQSFSDEQIECLVTKFQYLIDNWLDEFEKEVFDGKTLKEALRLKENGSK